MDSLTTENMSMDIDSTNAVDASIMSTVDMMQSCTLRDSGDDALRSEQAQDVDMDVDTPTNEATQANEMDIDSPQYEYIKYEVRLSAPYPYPKPQTHILTPSKHHHATTTAQSETTALQRSKAVHTSGSAPKPQHKHLKHLVGVDAKSKAPAAISSDKVVKASVQHGRSRLGPRTLSTLERRAKMESRFAHAVLEAIDEEA
jgi:hypothetical protein